jgi:hypothetical protein
MLASIKDCHFRTRDLSLSDVKSRPWKLVKQFFPWISSTRSLTFRNAWSSSFCKSAKDTSKILPFNASFAFLIPVVRLTRVFPTLWNKLDSHSFSAYRFHAYFLSTKEDGACQSYQQLIEMPNVSRHIPWLDTNLYVRKDLGFSSWYPSYPLKGACSYLAVRL